jgi:hypothetical protein
MGAASGPNRFWELFWRANENTDWKLVTPPGVADNGGLALGAHGPGLLVGFLPSFNLHFSPLATTTDDGTAWIPQLLPAGLAPTADALAVSSRQVAAALIAAQHGTVLVRPAPAATWKHLTSAQAVAATPAARRCGVDHISAVAFAASGALLVGGSCTHPGQIAIYTDTSGVWRDVAPALPPALARRRASVLTLTQTDATTFTLLDLAGSANTLVAAWSNDGGGHWQQTEPLALPAGSRLLAAGSSLNGATYVLSSARSMSLRVASRSTGTWLTLPTPPTGTAAVTIGSNEDHALVVHHAVLGEWTLAAGARQWRKIGSRRIPIQYGSSS